MKKIINFLSSLKLTIFMLIILAITSIIGTLIQQRQDPVIYLQQYGKPLYQTFQILGFFDLYHSWWFVTLLSLLALNLLFCTLRRIPRDWKILNNPRTKLTESEARLFTTQEKITIPNKSPQELLENVLQGMKSIGFPCKSNIDENKNYYLFSEKGKYGRFAFYITHLSILFIFLGAIIGATKGFKGFANIPEGEKIDSIILIAQDGRSISKDLGFEVECKHFLVTFYTDEQGNLTNRPKDFKSLLTIYEGGAEVLSKEIEVNNPLSYKGIYFYQSNYGEIPQVTITVKTPEGEIIGNFEIGEQDSFSFMDKNNQKREIELLRYLPDFTMNQNRQFISRSNIPNNPAALLEISLSSGEKIQSWVFQKFPDFPHQRVMDYHYSLTSINARKKYTGLQVVRDPGVIYVWIGCSILVIGIILMFSIPHQRLWINLIPDEKGKCTSITIIGNTNKNKPSFQNTFMKISTIFRSNLADRKEKV